MDQNKKIFLTIDDAPSIHFSEKINFLYKNNIPAVIFCIGKYMKERPDEIIDAIQKGYPVGNHSYTHNHFSNISLSKAREEIFATDKIINNLYNQAKKVRPVKLFRFPYGDKGWNKKFNFKYKHYLPSKINKKLNQYAKKTHRKEIQKYLNKLNYSHPTLTNIHYKKYRNFMKANDIYWTFDFCEYMIDDNEFKINSIDEIYAHMEKEPGLDANHSPIYQIGSLKKTSSDEIVLIHDHAKTTDLFYELIEHCINHNFTFAALPHDN